MDRHQSVDSAGVFGVALPMPLIGVEAVPIRHLAVFIDTDG